MHRLAASAAVALAWLTVAACRLPCDSQLRLLPVFAPRFKHCDCSYSEWTEWAPIKSTPVPRSQCSSGKVLTEERRQRVLSGKNCKEKRQEKMLCEPKVVDQLIMALGLGGRGQHITPGGAPRRPAQPIPPARNFVPLLDRPVFFNESTPGRFTRSNCDDAKQVCLHVTTPRGRRSVRELKRSHINRRQSTAEPEPLHINPTPFNVFEHGPRYRRQNTKCQPGGTQHILFVLDTSGSIGKTEFSRVTTALSNLMTLFCKPIKVAVMTFNQEYYVEFCFDCFDNTCSGRLDAGTAIKTINYRAGWTHTGGAARCVCDFMLTPTCGLDQAANCIDVIFITDGQSNDPSRNVCTDIQCLHNRFGVNTYAIGITKHVDQDELECITKNSLKPGQFNLFNFDTFDDFEKTLNAIIQVLLDPNPNNPFVCIDPQAEVGTNSCTR